MSCYFASLSQILPKSYHLIAIPLLTLGLMMGGLTYLEGVALSQTVAGEHPTLSTQSKINSPLTTSASSPAQIAPQCTIPRDIAVVMDISGSTEYETTCYDCWVRQDAADIDYPNNGYFNPLPYNPTWNPGGGSSIPHSGLCVAPPTALQVGGSKYLVHESELYSRNKGNWNLEARVPGQGFWVLQRGSRNVNNPNNPAEDGFWQGNQAGAPANQSSNVCNPGIAGGGLSCVVSGQNICATSVTGHTVDCSAYIKAHPFPTYSATAPALGPRLQGGAYNIECFPPLNHCWDSQPVADDGSRPFADQVPFVEYDFTSKWSGQTHIYIRARGGGDLAFKWLGQSPNFIDPVTQAWQKAVMWEVVGAGNLTQDTQAAEITTGQQSYRDNRATANQWQWLKLGAANTISGTQTTLRIFQASAGYKIDKLVFTDNSNAVAFLQGQNSGKGPKATNGSATRESCNVCNPAYGLTQHGSQCGCPANAIEAAAYVAGLGSPPTAPPYGSGQNCTAGDPTVPVDEPTNYLEDDLFAGLQPLRSIQEAVKGLAKGLDTDFDQIGLVAFGDNVVNDANRRTQLQCLRSDPANCENDVNRFPNFLQAVEMQWPSGSTNIAQGLKEGLLTLGIDNPTACNSTDPTSNCSRPGAKKILILVTDGSPNTGGDQCNGVGPLPVWNRTLSSPTKKKHYECALYYAKKAADSGVIVYTIGIGAGVNPDFLTAIAEGRDPHLSPDTGLPEEILFAALGGQFYLASNLADISAITADIEATTAVCSPEIEQVTITGPGSGLTAVTYPFTATVNVGAAQPITYLWQASQQSPITHSSGGSTDTVTFTWSITGTQAITVFANNAINGVSDTHTIAITTTPKEEDTKTYLPMILK